MIFVFLSVCLSFFLVVYERLVYISMTLYQ
jgi:hypothetical protein